MSKNVEWGERHGEGAIITYCDECGRAEDYDFYDADDMSENFRECQAEIRKNGWISRKIDDEWYDFCCEECYQNFLKKRSNKTVVSNDVVSSKETEIVEILDDIGDDSSYDDNHKMTNIGVKERMEQEGMDYALLHWRIEGKDVRNPKLAKLIDEAYESLKKLSDYLDDVIERQNSI